MVGDSCPGRVGRGGVEVDPSSALPAVAGGGVDGRDAGEPGNLYGVDSVSCKKVNYFVKLFLMSADWD